MSVDVVLVLLVVLVVGNYWLSRSVLYPPFLFCGMWLLDLSMYRMNLIETDPVHSNTLAIIGGGAVLFTCGAALALLFPKALIETRLILTRFPPRNKLVKPLLIAFLFCGIPLQVRYLIQSSALVQGPGSILQRSRVAGVEGAHAGDAEGGASPVAFLTSYLILWSIYAAPLFLLERRDRKFWLMTFIALAAGLLSTGRTPILMLIAAVTCVHLIMNNRQTFWAAIKFARIPITVFLFLYFGLVFLDKDTSAFEGKVAEVLLFFLVSYIVGPMVAFDYVLQHPQEYVGIPNHTFKFFLGIASSLHLIQYVPAPHYDTFIFVPYPTNVYTVYKYYYVDFGLYGMLIAITAIGLLQTLLYRKARTGSVLSIYLFALTIYPTIVCVFDDSYSAFGSYIDALLFGGMYIILRSIPIRVLPRLASGYGKQLAPNAEG